MKKDFLSFLKDLSTDEKLAADFNAAKLSGKDTDALVEFAKNHGYDITCEWIKEAAGRELTKDELESVAGGFSSKYVNTCPSAASMMFING